MALILAQNRITVKSSYYTVDSMYDVSPSKRVENLLNEYKSIVDDRMAKIVGKSEQTMTVSMPESLLTNLACDIIFEKGSEILNEPADLSLLDIGGFRADLLEETVLLGDIYNTFPSDNTIVIAYIKGKYLRQLFTIFAEKQMQPMSSVVLKIQNNQLLEALIGSQPLEDEKTYKLVTIDYLILGRDDMLALTKAEHHTSIQLALRDAIAEYFPERYRKGLQVESVIDGARYHY